MKKENIIQEDFNNLPLPKEIEEYIQSMDSSEKRKDILHFLAYMHKKYKEIIPVISYGIPTYKLEGKRRYVAFSHAKNHYSFHTTDFDVIDELRKKIEKAGNGKGSIKLAYGSKKDRIHIEEAIDKVVKRKI